MIVLTHLSQLNVAASRASKLNPKLRVKDFGEYEVSGSSGNWYLVTCRKMADGSKLVACSCEEKFPRRSGIPCYHMVPAVGAHILLAIARRSVILSDVR